MRFYRIIFDQHDEMAMGINYYDHAAEIIKKCEVGI